MQNLPTLLKKHDRILLIVGVISRFLTTSYARLTKEIGENLDRSVGIGLSVVFSGRTRPMPSRKTGIMLDHVCGTTFDMNIDRHRWAFCS